MYNKICSVDWCDKKHYSKGFCQGHFSRWKRGADMDKPWVLKGEPRPNCTIWDCGRKHYARGYCTLHYSRLLSGFDLLAPINDKILPRRPMGEWGKWTKNEKGYVINRQSFGWTIQFHWPGAFLLQSFALILGTALLSGWIPARWASRTPAPEVIRAE